MSGVGETEKENCTQDDQQLEEIFGIVKSVSNDIRSPSTPDFTSDASEEENKCIIEEERTKYNVGRKTSALPEVIESDSEESIVEVEPPIKEPAPVIELVESSSEEDNGQTMAKIKSPPTKKKILTKSPEKGKSSPVIVISDEEEEVEMISIQYVRRQRKKMKRQESVNKMKEVIENSIRSGVVTSPKAQRRAVSMESIPQLLETNVKNPWENLPVEVEELEEPEDVDLTPVSERPDYAGCKSWTMEMRKFYDDLNPEAKTFNLAEAFRKMPAFASWNVDTSDFHMLLGSKSRYFSATLPRTRCHNCHQIGHLQSQCTEPRKKIVCSMCGRQGHTDTRCPESACLTCGRPSDMYMVNCLQCRFIMKEECNRCGMPGHREPQCPDIWRRFHATVKPGPAIVPTDDPSSEQLKASHKQFCCNCARRGHLSHMCQQLRYSQYSIVLPNVAKYSEPSDNHPSVLMPPPPPPSNISLREVFFPTKNQPKHDVGNLRLILSARPVLLVKQLNLALKLLNTSYDNLGKDYIRILRAEANILNLRKNKLIHSIQKLSIVLVGQMGFNDGKNHISELQQLVGRLRKLKQKKASEDVMRQVYSHYNPVFGGKYTFTEMKDLMNLYLTRCWTSPKAKKISLMVKKFQWTLQKRRTRLETLQAPAATVSVPQRKGGKQSKSRGKAKATTVSPK